jgi:hypothetical protein
MTCSRPKKWLILAAVLLVGLCAWLVPPEVKYRRALQKYRPGVSVSALEREYGVHIQLEPSGNTLPYPPTEEQRRKHWAFELISRDEYVIVYFNADRKVIDVMKFTPLRLLWKLLTGS